MMPPAPLWKRALAERAAEAKPAPLRFGDRKFAPIAVGQQFGDRTVVELLGRGHRGRADMRVRCRCKCGKMSSVFEYQARLYGPCGHAVAGQPRRWPPKERPAVCACGKRGNRVSAAGLACGRCFTRALMGEVA